MNNFFVRAISGVAFVAILISSIIYGPYSYVMLFLTITVLGIWEFYGLVEKTGALPQKIYGTFTGACIFLSITGMIIYKTYWTAAIAVPLLFLCFFIELYRKKESPFLNIAYTLFGIFYLAFPFAMLLFLGFGKFSNQGNYDYHIILGCFLLVWTSDTFAYLTGKLLGKRKLFERISPGKTWEGSLGGAVFTMALGYILSVYFTQLSTFEWMGTAFIIIVAGTMGDLSKSLLKRSINVKDSGNIIPGHGGILDRFDAILLSTPFVLSFLYLMRVFS